MPDTPNQSDVDHQQPHEPSDPQTQADETEFTNLITALVADHAPRMFAIVIEQGNHLGAAITAWGIALDDRAYAITADGKTNTYWPLQNTPCTTCAAPPTPHPTSSGSIPPQPPRPNPPTNPRPPTSPYTPTPAGHHTSSRSTRPAHTIGRPVPTNRETVNAEFPPCPDCGVALTDPSVQHQPDYPADGPLRQPTPYLRLAATAEQADAHIFDLPNDIDPELAAAIAIRFDDNDHIHAIISLATDLDEGLRTDVLAYVLALYIADPQRIANNPDAILTVSRTRLRPAKHGPGHLAWHMLHSCGRKSSSVTFELIPI